MPNWVNAEQLVSEGSNDGDIILVDWKIKDKRITLYTLERVEGIFERHTKIWNIYDFPKNWERVICPLPDTF